MHAHDVLFLRLEERAPSRDARLRDGECTARLGVAERGPEPAVPARSVEEPHALCRAHACEHAVEGLGGVAASVEDGDPVLPAYEVLLDGVGARDHDAGGVIGLDVL